MECVQACMFCFVLLLFVFTDDWWLMGGDLLQECFPCMLQLGPRLFVCQRKSWCLENRICEFPLFHMPFFVYFESLCFFAENALKYGLKYYLKFDLLRDLFCRFAHYLYQGQWRCCHPVDKCFKNVWTQWDIFKKWTGQEMTAVRIECQKK